MKEWAEDSTAGCEASGLFDEDEGSSHGQRMMSGEQGLELSGEAQWRLRYLWRLLYRLSKAFTADRDDP